MGRNKESGMKLTGDWSQLIRKTARLNALMNIAIDSWLTDVGLEGEKIALRIIEEQEFEELSDEYLKYKKEKGLSELIYVATGTYRQNITSLVYGEAVFIGVLRGVRHKDGSELVDIAAVLEFGSEKQNIPERPLWRPTVAELRVELKTGRSVRSIERRFRELIMKT